PTPSSTSPCDPTSPPPTNTQTAIITELAFRCKPRKLRQLGAGRIHHPSPRLLPLPALSAGGRLQARIERAKDRLAVRHLLGLRPVLGPVLKQGPLQELEHQ